MLRGKRILLGVSGSIAAYKAAFLVRELCKQRAQVQVVMTPAATRFITPLTLQTLSGQAVLSESFPQDSRQPLAHIKLAQSSDLLLLAPATANTIAKLAAGIADSLLTSLCLATRAPILIAPAMNSNMYTHPSVQANIQTLKERGVRFVEPESGELACGEEGPGRLADIMAIIAKVQQVLTPTGILAGLKVLITAGPTREPIDELRFISNRSSGKMGYALAEEACQRGAQVTLISGPANLPPPEGVKTIAVQTAQEMQAAVEQSLADTQVLVMAAAVADYTPAAPMPGKLKKEAADLELKLEPTPDILTSIGQRSSKPLLIGFAAESTDVVNQARQKLAAKGLDLIIANHISQAGTDDNQITIIDKVGKLNKHPLMPKSECAKLIWDRVEGWVTRSEVE